MTDDQRLTDAELVDLLAQGGEGDTRPFEELVRRYQAKVVTNCRYLSGSPDDAEDLAQEVFVKVFFGLGGFEHRSSFETWLQRVKSNHCINFVRKKEISTTGLDTSEAEVAAARPPTAERDVDRAEMRDRIGGVLLQMNETLRIPLVLRDMDGMSYDEIAEEVGVGLSAVKMRIKRGREEFRRLYAEWSVAPEAEAAG